MTDRVQVVNPIEESRLREDDDRNQRITAESTPWIIPSGVLLSRICWFIERVALGTGLNGLCHLLPLNYLLIVMAIALLLAIAAHWSYRKVYPLWSLLSIGLILIAGVLAH